MVGVAHPSIPTFFACDGKQLERLLFQWLGRPDLDEAILVSFGFNPQYKGKDATLGHKLERLAKSTEVTLVTTLSESTAGGPNRHFNAFQRLISAGVRILIHDTLHAKTFLLRRGDKVCWVVGSSNLTAGGFSRNTEVNVAGYQIIDYQTVYSQVQGIIGGAYPL